ncbi:MAG: DoxX family protein [Nocardioides sp.]
MTVNSESTKSRSSSVGWNKPRYWLLTGLLVFMMGYSALWTLVDPQGTYDNTEKLGFPGFIGTYPLAAAKIAAVVVIVWRRWPVLTIFAFAGLIYDVSLALMAHIYEGDFPSGWLAVLGVVIWCGAFWAERDRVAHERQGGLAS